MKKSILIVLLSVAAGVLYGENIGVPSECEDVMLQGFYWDSYDNSKPTTKYGRTKWVDLLKDTAAINACFDLVWLPPSATSSGGVGYIHAQLSNQEVMKYCRPNEQAASGGPDCGLTQGGDKSSGGYSHQPPWQQEQLV